MVSGNNVQLPQGWARQGEVLVLSVMPDRSLVIYTQQAWHAFLETLDASNKTMGKQQFRMLQRSLVGCAEECTVPDDGIVRIPELLLELLSGKVFEELIAEDGWLLFK